MDFTHWGTQHPAIFIITKTCLKKSVVQNIKPPSQLICGKNKDLGIKLLVEMYNFDKHLDIRLSKYIRQDHLICRNAETC